MSKMFFIVFKARRYSTWRMWIEVARCCPPPGITALSWWELQTEGRIHQFNKVLLRKSDKLRVSDIRVSTKLRDVTTFLKLKGTKLLFKVPFPLECYNLWLLLSYRESTCVAHMQLHCIITGLFFSFLLEVFSLQTLVCLCFFCP